MRGSRVAPVRVTAVKPARDAVSAIQHRPSWSELINSFLRPPRTTVIAVLPNSSELRARGPRVSRTASATPNSEWSAKTGPLTFFEVFGLLGPPLLLVVVVSAVWTTWLIALNSAPNETANYLMGTTDFDNGTFWLLIDPSPTLFVASVFGLGTVLLGFTYALLKMTLWRNQTLARGASLDRVIRRRRGSSERRALSFWSNVTGFHGTHRKLWVRL